MPGAGCKARWAAAAAWVFAESVGAASFQAPREWVAATGVDVELPGAGSNLVQRTAADGGTLVIAPGSSGLASVIVHDPALGARFAQIGDSDSGLRLEPVLWRDLGQQHGLVAMDEVDRLGARRRLLLSIDRADGSLRWAQPLETDRALALDDGSTLVRSLDGLVALDARGIPTWARSLREFAGPRLRPEQDEWDTDAATVFGTFLRTRFDDVVDGTLVALDRSSGALRWQVDPGWAATLGLCAAHASSGTVLTVRTASTGTPGSYVVHAERRAAADGALLGSTSWPTTFVADECRVVDAGGRTVVLAREDSGPTDVSALSSAGALLWQRSWTAIGPRTFASIPGTGDVVVVTPSPDNADARLERLRSTDGTSAWAMDLTGWPAGSVALAAVGAEVLATTTRGSALDVARLDAATGAVPGQASHAIRRRQLLPATGIFVDTTPFDLAAGFGPDRSLLRLRRLDPASEGAAQWSTDLAGLDTTTEATAVGLHAAGTTALLARAEYMTASADAEQRVVLHAVDPADGSVRWRRVVDRLRPASFFVWNTTADGALVGWSTCGATCATGTSTLVRLSMVDGTTRWERTMVLQEARFAAGDVLVLRSDPGPTARWERLSGLDGSTLWSQAIAAGLSYWDVDASMPGTFQATYRATVGGLQVVDVEQRDLAGGTADWTLRAGIAGDQVTSPSLRRMADGSLLLAARVRGPEPGQVGLMRPLLQGIDPLGQSLSLLRPLIVGDQYWDLRRLVAAPGSPTTPLRSMRYLVSGTLQSNQRLSLAGIDAANVLTGEHLIERRFDDPLIGLSGLGLVRVTADGSVLATEPRVFDAGLRRPSLVRLAAPGPARGDLQLRVIDAAGFGIGMGPVRRLVAEVDNVGTFDALGASAGIASRRDVERAFAVAVGCEVIAGTGTCLATRGADGELRFDLGANSTLRLTWDVFDPRYTNSVAPGLGIATGGRVFVDSPYAFGDLELGNQVVSFVLRTGAFADDFE